MAIFKPEVVEILRCPYCMERLDGSSARFACRGCDASFPVVDGQPDFRLTRPVQRTMTFSVGSDRPDPEQFPFSYPMPPAPESWIGKEHWDKVMRPNVTLLSYIPRPRD